MIHIYIYTITYIVTCNDIIYAPTHTVRIKIRRDRSSSSTCRSIHRPAATRVTPTSIVTTILFLRFCRPWECRVERTGRVALAAGPTHLWPPGPTLTVHLRYAVCGRRRGISEKSRCKAVVQQQKKKKNKGHSARFEIPSDGAPRAGAREIIGYVLGNGQRSRTVTRGLAIDIYRFARGQVTKARN